MQSIRLPNIVVYIVLECCRQTCFCCASDIGGLINLLAANLCRPLYSHDFPKLTTKFATFIFNFIGYLLYLYLTSLLKFK